MIVPTRFGLKYAPIPTLALEYEDDLKGVVDSSDASLYVYRDGGSAPPPGPARKLHVVELPMLTPTSETQQVLRRLQQDNGRFLAPGVVNEAQLKRLLDRLVANLQMSSRAKGSGEEDEHVVPPASAQHDSTEPADASGHQHKESDAVGRGGEKAVDDYKHDGGDEADEEEELGQSFLEESIAEASQSLEQEQKYVDEAVGATTLLPIDPPNANPNRGTFLSQEEESDEEEAKEDPSPNVNTNREQATNEEEQGGQGKVFSVTAENNSGGFIDSATAAENEKEKEEDAAKMRALRSEEEVSDEEVQSEELEYFSEDGSDEDSF